MAAIFLALCVLSADDPAAAKKAALERFPAILKAAEKRAMDRDIKSMSDARAKLIAQEKLILWQRGLRESEGVWPEDLRIPKFAVGQFGTLPTIRVLEITSDHILARTSVDIKGAKPEYVFIVGRGGFDLEKDALYELRDVFIVTDTRMIGRQKAYDVEPLNLEYKIKPR